MATTDNRQLTTDNQQPNIQMNQSTNHSFFAQPKFLVGSRAMEHIHIELDGYNASRPMVIASKADNVNVKRFIRALADSNITIAALVDNALPYVNPNEIEKLAGLFHWRECDSIIALGGKRVMDIAKALNLKVNGLEMESPLKIKMQLKPLIYIATERINGNEVTNTINIDGKILHSDSIYPDIVCIDNRMVSVGNNFNSLVFAAFNSLAHCIEGAETANSNPFVDASALTAIRLIVDNLKIIIRKPNDKKAGVGLANGIAIAGTISSNTQGDICCLCAKHLSKETRLPRGMLAGIMLAPSLQYKKEKGMDIRHDLLLAMVGIEEFCSTPKQNKITKAIKEIRRITNSLEKIIPRTLSELKVQEQILTRVAQRVEEDSKGQIEKDFCYNFLQKYMEERQ